MNRKLVRKISWTFGILFLMILLANFGVNFWLKNKLPNYIKNNSDYTISYKNLEVDLGTGNIFANGISVKNKNHKNPNVLGINGSLDTLKISKLNIVKILLGKQISVSDIILSNPTLEIRLPLPKNQKNSKKKLPFDFNNLKINNGNITVLDGRFHKKFSVQQLDFSLEDFESTENPNNDQLPFEFGNYKLKAEQLFLRPDAVQLILAKKITTENGKLNVVDFQIIPLLSQKQFQHFFPEKKNQIALKTKNLQLSEVTVKNKKINITSAVLDTPQFTLYKTNTTSKTEKKEINIASSVQNILLNQSSLQIIEADGTTNFSAENIQFSLKDFLFNKETASEKIPFRYKDFKVSGKNILLKSKSQQFRLGNLELSPKSGIFQKLSVTPLNAVHGKTVMNFTTEYIRLKMNDFGFVGNDMKLDVDQIFISGLNGSVKTKENTRKKVPQKINGIVFPIKINKVTLQKSNFTWDKDNQPLIFKDLQANLNAIEISEKADKKGVDFSVGNYSVATRNFNYKTKFYDFGIGLLKLNKNKILVSNFSMIPTVSRQKFIKMIPTERDLYTIKAAQISLNGNWDFTSKNKYLNASELNIDYVNSNIFRSKIPKDDPKIKPMYSELLRTIKFPLFISDLNIRNSLLEYEEDTEKSNGAGKLTFGNFNLNAKNINSGKMKGKPTAIPITINCKFFNISPMHVKWNMNTANFNDAFTISGNISDLPAPRINQFVEPYLKIRTTGTIKELKFDFNGNKKGLNGTVKMNHEKLKISLLKKDGEKDKVLSTIANVFVKSNTNNTFQNAVVDNVPRNPTKSFFNLFWKGIEEGLKKILLGKNIEKTENLVKNKILKKRDIPKRKDKK